jgi:hypothetical protein
MFASFASQRSSAFFRVMRPQTSCVNLALFANDTCLYVTQRRKIQHGLNSMAA